VISHWKLAENGDDAPQRWAFIVGTLRKLKAENRLASEREKLLPEAEAQLAKKDDDALFHGAPTTGRRNRPGD
jgi:hypothetical protein